MLMLHEVGRRVGRRQLARDPEGVRAGAGVVDAATFGLFGLLIAFTFSGAAARFEARRHLIVEEANAIGTAWLRLDLLPPDAQPALRDLFRRYLDSRLEVYRLLPDLDAALDELQQNAALQGEIWARAVAACRGAAGQPATVVLLPALNAMIDITTTRTMAGRLHPPPVVFVLLVTIGLVCAMFAGYASAGARRRSWTHAIGFTTAIAITVYVILDFEYPRLGLIRVDSGDQVLVELRESMR